MVPEEAAEAGDVLPPILAAVDAPPITPPCSADTVLGDTHLSPQTSAKDAMKPLSLRGAKCTPNTAELPPPFEAGDGGTGLEAAPLPLSVGRGWQRMRTEAGEGRSPDGGFSEAVLDATIKDGGTEKAERVG
jgi:hypothetical protein